MRITLTSPDDWHGELSTFAFPEWLTTLVFESGPGGSYTRFSRDVEKQQVKLEIVFDQEYTEPELLSEEIVSVIERHGVEVYIEPNVYDKGFLVEQAQGLDVRSPT